MYLCGYIYNIHTNKYYLYNEYLWWVSVYENVCRCINPALQQHDLWDLTSVVLEVSPIPQLAKIHPQYSTEKEEKFRYSSQVVQEYSFDVKFHDIFTSLWILNIILKIVSCLAHDFSVFPLLHFSCRMSWDLLL